MPAMSILLLSYHKIILIYIGWMNKMWEIQGVESYASQCHPGNFQSCDCWAGLLRVRYCLFGDHCSSSRDGTAIIPLSLIFGADRIVFTDSVVAGSVKIPQIYFAKVPQDSLVSVSIHLLGYIPEFLSRGGCSIGLTILTAISIRKCGIFTKPGSP